MKKIMAENNLDSQNLQTESSNFPGFTEFKEYRICCFRFYSIPSLHQMFCGHWEVKPFFPLLFAILSFSSLFIVLFLALPYFGIEGKIMSCVIFILFFLFASSYFRIISDGPGYYPFYYGTSFQPPNTDNSLLGEQFNSPSGIISNSEQFEWCTNRAEKPPRSILSKTARRFVLRPEHYCRWASSWIGKRNHKFFMLFTLYGLLYLGLFVVYLARRLAQCFNDTFSLLMILLTIYSVTAAAFFLMLVSYFVSNMIDISLNRTSWEQWNGIDQSTFDNGLCLNLEDVFGSRKRFFCWICPFSPWKDKSNEDISVMYHSYQLPDEENINNCFE